MAEKNIYLFYGPDHAAREKKLRAWVDRFKATGDALMDMEEIDGESATWEKLQTALTLVPLLTGKRLLIIRRLLASKSDLKNKLADFYPRFIPELILVLIEEDEVDSSLGLYKIIDIHGKCYHFAKPTLSTLLKQLNEYLVAGDLKMDMPARALLVERVSGDSLRLDNEILKLQLFADGQKITKEMVAELVSLSFESRIFVLIDAILSKQVGRAGELMLSELESGTAPLQITALLINQVRKLLYLKDGLERKITNQEILKKVGVPPFVFTKMKSVVDRLSLASLINYQLRLSMADYQLKTGADEKSVLLSIIKLDHPLEVVRVF